jgi:hypothetical protein
MDYQLLIENLKLDRLVPDYTIYRENLIQLFESNLNSDKYCWIYGYLQYYQGKIQGYNVDNSKPISELVKNFAENNKSYGLDTLCTVNKKRFICIRFCENYFDMDRKTIYGIIKPYMKNYSIENSTLNKLMQRVQFIMTFIMLYRIISTIKRAVKLRMTRLFSDVDYDCITKMDEMLDSGLSEILSVNKITRFVSNNISSSEIMYYGSENKAIERIIGRILKWKQHNRNTTDLTICEKIPDFKVLGFGHSDSEIKALFLRVDYYYLFKFYHKENTSMINLMMPKLSIDVRKLTIIL